MAAQRHYLVIVPKQPNNMGAPVRHAIENLGWTNEETNERGKSTRLEIYDWIKGLGGACVRSRLAQ